MNWNALNAPGQLGDIKNESVEKTVLIFKHSTRCNISRATLSRLERHWNQDEMKDVKAYVSMSVPDTRPPAPKVLSTEPSVL